MTSPGLIEAIRLLKASKRKPDDADRPPAKPLPGRKIKPLPGQLDLDGNEVSAPSPLDDEDELEETPAA